MAPIDTRRLLRAALGGGATVLALVSLVPLIETNLWLVRVLDFPRLHYLVGLLVTGVLYLVVARPRRPWRHPVDLAVAALVLAALGYNAWKLGPYMGRGTPMATTVASCPEASRVRVLIANVQLGNHQAEPLLDIVREVDPDLFFAMETDAWWNRQLAALDSRFPYKVQHLDPDYFGLHLFSKLELLEPEIWFPASEDVPALITGLALRDGGTARFFGVHPRPPTWSQPSTYRDAQILAAALLARDGEAPAIVAGDLNAVPWERTTRRALRIGSLLDPRVGRGYYASFNAANPIMWWPLDQILFQDAFAPLDFERLPGFGSDHFPILTELCHAPTHADAQSAPELAEDDLAEARTALRRGLRPEALAKLRAEIPGLEIDRDARAAALPR